MKTGIYVDGAYAVLAARHDNRQIDFFRLSSFLDTLSGDTVEKWWFDATDSEHDSAGRRAVIRRAGFRLEMLEVRLRDAVGARGERLYTRDGKPAVVRKQVGVDTLLVDSIVRAQCRYGTLRAVLLAGDGDFAPTVKRLVDLGNEVVIVAESQSLDPEMRVLASHYVDLSKIWSQVTRAGVVIAPSAIRSATSAVAV